MKYVVLQETRGMGLRTAVLCAAPVTHRELAEKFSATHKPISAGFCEFIVDGRVRVFGHSTSLNLQPAAGDGPLIEALAKATRATAPV